MCIRDRTNALHLVEIDQESIQFLQTNYSSEEIHLIEADFLKLDLNRIFSSEPFAIIGNFPYNISSQIVFKVLENRIKIPFFAGMFQKEVAERICEPSGSKKYCILSVLSQLYYETEYLFTVPPTVFNHPPKVDSAVIRLTRKQNIDLDLSLIHISEPTRPY